MYGSLPETIRGIPEDQWIHPQLMDTARMTDKQRHAYWYQIGRSQIELLMTKGNFVGEKPDRAPTLETWVREREAAFQRALDYQMEVFRDNERIPSAEPVGSVLGEPSTESNQESPDPS
jgi:hypothetical protein